MSWKKAGQLLQGPPTSTNSVPLDKRFKPNLGGLNAFQREQQYSRYYTSGSSSTDVQGRTEWDVLKENHRFIRDDEEPGDVSWEERLARAYESKLFKEFALIDLKHYKSKRLALRWRTAPEVVQGLGEETCGSLRCKHHQPPIPVPITPSSNGLGIHFDYPHDEDKRDGKRKRKKRDMMPGLRSFELPFAYVEGGERKEALVKVRLCPRCEGKLLWKPGQVEEDADELEESMENQRRERSSRDERSGDKAPSKRRSRSRSRSPRRRGREE